jgi:hypothetical protein
MVVLGIDVLDVETANSKEPDRKRGYFWAGSSMGALSD